MVYLILILGLGTLLLGGKLLVDGASSIAAKLGLSAGLIGLTVVAFGTSAPELLVSISAALKGTSDIAIGNVIGSNIANISLVLGISAMLYPIALNINVLKLDYLFTLLSSLLFFILSYNNVISRFEGFIFVILLVSVNLYIFKKLRGTEPELTEDEAETLKKESTWKSVGLIILGITGLYFGSDMFVDSAVKISRVYGVSERIIGVTVIAMGTSLPELTTSIIAAINKKTDIAIGNILGSNIMNVLGIIGITALVRPIEVTEQFLNQDFIWMLLLTVILFPILRLKLKVSRLEGAFLVLYYATYLFYIL